MISIKNSGTPKAEKQEAKKAEAAAVAMAPKVDDSILGSMSDKVAFVNPLGDPSHPDVTTDKDNNKTTTPYIVGYRFKALADIEVPECGLDKDARKNLMSYIPENKNNKKAVKAGEEFMLTRFETALLLAPPEFNGRISGGGKEFSAVYQTVQVKSKKGAVGEVSSATKVPTVALKAERGSIKDYEIEEVLTFTKTEENGVVRKKRQIRPGYEKFEALCFNPEPKARAQRSGASSKNVRNAKAEAFLAIVNAR